MPEQRRPGAFPWTGEAHKLKARIIEAPFHELDNLLGELSTSILSIEKDNMEIGESPPVSQTVGATQDADRQDIDYVDFLEEYGSEELDEEYWGEKADEEEKMISDLEQDYSRGAGLPPFPPELEIRKTAHGDYEIFTHTNSAVRRWRRQPIGDTNMDNAATVVFEALSQRQDLVDSIGKYFVMKLNNYLDNINETDRHWHLVPLKMKDIPVVNHGTEAISAICRAVNGTRIKLPNGEIEKLRNFFGTEQTPISGRAIMCEIARIVKQDPKTTCKKIAAQLNQTATEHRINLNFNADAARRWKGKMK